METLSITEYTRRILLSRTLREGLFTDPSTRKYGEQTQLWQSIVAMHPVQQGTDWTADAQFFLTRPVFRGFQQLQRTLNEINQTHHIPPTPGEDLAASYIPRVIAEVAQRRATDIGSNTINLTPQALRLVTPMDINHLRALIISSFGFESFSPTEQSQLLEKIGQMVFERLAEQSLELMNESDKTEFQTLLSTEQPDFNAIIAFMEQTVPDFDELLASQVLALKTEFDTTYKQINPENTQNNAK